MKKALILILTLSMLLALFAVPSFADEVSEEEKAEILDVSLKGWCTYETLGGMAFIAMSPHYSDYTEKYIEDFISCPKERYGDLEIPGYYYLKTKFTTKEEVQEYIDEIFIGNTFDVNERFSEDKDGGYYKMILVDGYIYIPTTEGHVVTMFGWDFDNAEIEIVGDKATVTLMQEKDSPMLGLPDDYSETIELFKTGDEWKICGGTLFMNLIDKDFYVPFYSETVPPTGENTFLYLAISAACLVTMTGLVVGKKRKTIA